MRGLTGMPRREFLTAGVLTGFGLGLADFLRLQAVAQSAGTARPHAPANSVIHVFLPGGLPQQDSFDPKPLSPPQYRGALKTIPTRLAGVRFSALFPRTAEVVDRLAIVRSMSHQETDHDRGKLYMYSGHEPNPAIQFPSVGSIVAREFGSSNVLPPYVWYPLDPDVFPRSGFLSSAFDPFSLGTEHAESDPASDRFRVRDLALPTDVDAERFRRRIEVLSHVNRRFVTGRRSPKLEDDDQFYQRAHSMVTSPKAREAFEIGREPERVRQRYGRNSAGQGLLLARRLVEAGVRFVSLNYPPTTVGSAGAWDLHIDCHDLINELAPPIDRAFSVLVQDLDERGLLDSTLVLLSTEFGRTPRINAAAGRDHWPRVFSVVLAGGGLRRGVVYGSSDSTAAEPQDDPVSVADLTRTVYDRLGIDPDQEIVAPGDRPLRLVDGGRVLRELLA